MQVGMIGLGRMGMNMARRLLQDGHEVVAYNRTPAKVGRIAAEGAVPSSSLEDLVKKLTHRRVIWMMLPIGGAIDDSIAALKPLLSKGDILVDGGNSFYKDDLRRAEQLQSSGIRYVDAGVSGGIWGLKVGYCTMVGGHKDDFTYVEPLLKTLAPPGGYMYCGPTGAGHFVKMVHNGIEYGMMEAYGEGFEILKASPYAQDLNFANVARMWNSGSVIRSWLLELLESAFEKDPHLDGIKGYVEDSGEGRWTVQQAIESGVSATSLAHAVFKRFQSRQQEIFSNKVLAALRNEFGGHAIARAGDDLRSSSAGAGSVEAARPDKDKTTPS
jgi:6-phosphogluconate dehydrogenase